MTAHGVHYAMLVVGLLGVGVLVLVQLRGNHEEQAGPAHANRGERGSRVVSVPTTASPAWASLWWSRPQLPLVERVVVPVAFVSSAAAAGVHAAVGPAHLRESTLFGIFFASSAMLQLLWAGALLVHRKKALLLAGALGNAAVVLLWALTRTAGLPFGLLPEPEAVGPWDLASVVWELTVVVSCLLLLASPPARSTLAPWREWARSAHLYAVGSVLLLAALAFSGTAV